MKPRFDTYDTYAKIYKKDTSMPCVLFPIPSHTKNITTARANWHEELEIQYIYSGEGCVLIDGEKHEVKAGDMVAINSNCVHLDATDSKLNYMAMIISTDFLRYADIDFSGVSFESVIRDERMEKLFSDVIAACGEQGRVCQRARVQMKLLALVTELYEYHTQKTAEKPKSNHGFETVKAAIAFIREGYSRKLSLDEIAAKVSTDKYNLSRSFKSATGQTVVGYINNYRCDRAKELIRSGAPINEAAIQCGFNNMSFFTKTFRKYTGVNPSEYKKK